MTNTILGMLGGRQLKPTVILLSSTVLMLTWRYFGSPEFYLQWISPRLMLWGNSATTAAVYSFAACLLLLGVVPALIVKLIFRERLADYGVQIGILKYTVRSFLVLGPMFVLAAYMASKCPAILAQYPINESAGGSSAMFGFHACTYMLFYLGWEFHFRGFLQFGLRDAMGSTNAVLVQVMASVLLHIGKPAVETYGAILGGILWGILAFRTRSLLSGLLQHALLGIALDWFICYW